MSELPPSGLTMKPQDGVHQSMCLQLQNNDLLKSSSTSSSSSSPDSTYSLSSLDVELPEGMMGRKAAASEDDSGIQSPDCRPDDNDNSVSFYLDAKEEGWNDQDNVTTIQNQNHESDNVFSDAAVDKEQGRRGLGDSSATEAQLFTSENGDGEDEDEDSFLSLRSADVIMRKQSDPDKVQMYRQDCVGPVIEHHQEAFQDSVDHPNEEGHMCSSTMRPCMALVNKVHQEQFQDSVDPPKDADQMSSSAMMPSVGLVSELHQETFQDSVDHPNEEGHTCSSIMRPSVTPVKKVHQEEFQDSVDLPKDADQMSSSAMRSFVGLVSELHQETFHDSVDHPNEEGHMCSSILRPIVTPVNKVHQEEFQDSVDPPKDANQMSSSAIWPSVGLVSELHQETFHDSVDHPNEEGHTCSSVMRPSVTPVNKVHQEAFQDSVNPPKNADQMSSSAIRPGVGLVSELHQETFQDSVDHPNEEGQMCSSTTRPSVAPVNKVHQETFQDSVDPPNEAGQMSSSAMMPSVGLVSELHQESSQNSVDHPNEEGHMFSSTTRPSVAPVNKVPQEAFQDSVDPPKDADQMSSSAMRPCVGLVSELHQDTFQDSVDHPNEEGHMCSSTTRPSVAPANKVHQEAFQDSVDPPNEAGQMSSSAMRPFVGLVSELHQETFQDSVDHPNEEGHMCCSATRPSVAPVNKVHQEAFQDSVDPPNEAGQMSSSALRPGVGLESEHHQETSQVCYNSMMQRSAKMTDLDLKGELHYKAYQETAELQKKQEQMHCSNRSLDVDSVGQEALQESLEFHNEENQIQTSTKRLNVDLVSEIQQEDVQTSIDLSTKKSLSQPTAELINQIISSSVPQAAHPSRPIQNIKDPTCFPKRNLSQNSSDPLDLSHTTDPPKITSTKVEFKRFSGPNLKDVKPKVISRATSTPRPANTDHSAASSEKNSLTRSRAANRKGQSDDGVKNRSSSTQARTSTPLTISDSDSKSSCLPMVKKQPSDFSVSKVVTNGNHVQTASSKAIETLRDEKDSHKEDTRDGDRDDDQTVSSDLRPTGVVTRVPNRGCVSVGVRSAPLSGVPKMKVIDSNTAMSGSSPSWKPPLKSTSSKLPIKSGGLPTSLSSSSVGSTGSENKGVAQVMKSEETCGRSSQGKPASTKPAAGIRSRTNTPVKPNTAGQKATAHVIQTKTTQNALQRGGSARPSRNSASVCPSSRGPRGTRLAHTHSEVEEEKKNRSILQLRSLVSHGNRKLEALAIVVQHIFNEREEALKQKKELSIQLKNLREELAQSVVRCERLECERVSVCAQLDSAVLTLQQQHQADLTQLEERLRDFYSAEWDKAHQAYQDEADRCTALMRQQVEEVKSKQEALRTEQEVAHDRLIKELRQGYESMLAELQKNHERDRQELDNTHKSSEAALNERISSLMKESESLSERLRETEEKRKALADKNQRDSRVVYLEQELESLKVVLELKTDQLHQQDKKLMQMDKLIESNVKLEEFVTKLQQENEDYKARMDKHAELSRQLSSEQAMLQQTLQKESKANKRLSMENEELLWKLHNGLSPRNSASFPSSPISPR
ncbi:uncharacterized protein mtus1b isoform X2 [Hemibagrus wyckioides]|uniref:uncharacterized protein mtus1b isoform X2 n=1 Tax=Hemibagrus wyckioides TaxID=337641 RepID=UPI00266BA320|nr:uncharacterized protein mtus1b isoform X2 [Hemibagrus wyckioides]